MINLVILTLVASQLASALKKKGYVSRDSKLYCPKLTGSVEHIKSVSAELRVIMVVRKIDLISRKYMQRI